MENAVKTKQKQGPLRILWLDTARVVAIVAVTVNHAVSRSFAVYENTSVEFRELPLLATVLKTVLYIFSRMGVPLFLMISGSIFLNRDFEDARRRKRFLKHNWLSLLVTTEIWLTIMFWYLQVFDGSVLRTEGLLRAIIKYIETVLFINQVTMGSMWYLPMILCVYLVLPILSIALKKMDIRFLCLPMGIVLISGMLVPTLNEVLQAAGINKNVDFALSTSDVFSVYCLYLFAGYCVYNGRLKSLNTGIVITGFLAVFSITVGFQMWIYSTASDYAIKYADIGVLAASTFLFELIRRTSMNIDRKWITFMSRIAFGIYFVHICIMTGVDWVLKVEVARYFKRFLILELVSLLGSIAIVGITQKNRLAHRYLYDIK